MKVERRNQISEKSQQEKQNLAVRFVK